MYIVIHLFVYGVVMGGTKKPKPIVIHFGLNLITYQFIKLTTQYFPTARYQLCTPWFSTEDEKMTPYQIHYSESYWINFLVSVVMKEELLRMPLISVMTIWRCT